MLKHHENIIDLSKERTKRGLLNHDPSYQLVISQMSKIELLEEMVRFPEKIDLRKGS